MYSVNTNTTLMFTTLFTLAEERIIRYFEICVGAHRTGVPAFIIDQNYNRYVVEPNLRNYGLYTYDDYFGGLGLPICEGGTIEIAIYLKKLSKKA